MTTRTLTTGAMVLLIATACADPELVHDGESSPIPEETSNDVRACVDDDCSYRTVESALAAAPDGGTVRILPGVYRDGGVVRAHRVRIEAEGAHLFGAAWELKANLVIKGNDVVIEGLRCSHIRVPDDNGACVRAEGRNLTLRRVHFHDSQTGILGGPTGGSFVIEDSTFERMGNRGDEIGNAHAIYIGDADELVLRRSRVVETTGEGHEVKSRAARTVVENCVLASLEGRDSRQIDVPNGGDVVIRENVLQKGRNSRNDEVIGIGHERGRGRGTDHADNRAIVEDNIVVIDRGGWNIFVNVRNVPAPLSRNNLIIGGQKGLDGDNRWFRDREAAGLPAYPFLPEPE